MIISIKIILKNYSFFFITTFSKTNITLWWSINLEMEKFLFNILLLCLRFENIPRDFNSIFIRKKRKSSLANDASKKLKQTNQLRNLFWSIVWRTNSALTHLTDKKLIRLCLFEDKWTTQKTTGNFSGGTKASWKC